MNELVDFLDNGGLKKVISNSISIMSMNELEHYMVYELGMNKYDTRKAIDYLISLLDTHNIAIIDNLEENITLNIKNILVMTSEE